MRGEQSDIGQTREDCTVLRGIKIEVGRINAQMASFITHGKDGHRCTPQQRLERIGTVNKFVVEMVQEFIRSYSDDTIVPRQTDSILLLGVHIFSLLFAMMMMMITYVTLYK